MLLNSYTQPLCKPSTSQFMPKPINEVMPHISLEKGIKLRCLFSFSRLIQIEYTLCRDSAKPTVITPDMRRSAANPSPIQCKQQTIKRQITNQDQQILSKILESTVSERSIILNWYYIVYQILDILRYDPIKLILYGISNIEYPKIL